MCGRYNLITEAKALVDYFEIEQVWIDLAELRPYYNIAPSQNIPIVRNTGNGRELALVRWGLVPHWSAEAKLQYSTINARAETVADKPAYREAFKRRRCLIPATGFYEWKREGENKVPHHIRLAEGGLFAFAGLWDHWDKNGTGFDSCSIIVTTANAAMKPVHDRMPVILNQPQYNTWLNTGHYNRAQLQSLLVPYSGAIEVRQVSRYVNSPAHDDPHCLEK